MHNVAKCIFTRIDADKVENERKFAQNFSDNLLAEFCKFGNGYTRIEIQRPKSYVEPSRRTGRKAQPLMQVDVTDHTKTANDCGIATVPTYQFYINGPAPMTAISFKFHVLRFEQNLFKLPLIQNHGGFLACPGQRYKMSFRSLPSASTQPIMGHFTFEIRSQAGFFSLSRACVPCVSHETHAGGSMRHMQGGL